MAKVKRKLTLAQKIAKEMQQPTVSKYAAKQNETLVKTPANSNWKKT